MPTNTDHGSILPESFPESKFDEVIDAGLIYFAFQSGLCGIIAIFTLRMKFLWFPQIIVIAVWFISRCVIGKFQLVINKTKI